MPAVGYDVRRLTGVCLQFEYKLLKITDYLTPKVEGIVCQRDLNT